MSDLPKTIGDSVGGVWDAGEGIWKIHQINKLVDKHAEALDLTPEEVDELRGAYVWEDTYGG